MKRIIALLLILAMCFSFAACAKQGAAEEDKPKADVITITDMMGREVDIPADTKNITVASTYGVVTPFLSTLQISDRVLAINFKNKSFYRLAGDPIISAGTIGTTNNLDSEALAAAAPDLYICKISDQEKIDIATRLGVPSITLSAEIPEEVLQAYEMLGKALGCEDRAKEIIDYLNGELKEIDKLAATIPADAKKTALCMGSAYSRVAGEDMLQTLMLQRIGAITLVDGIVGDEERYWADCGVEKVFELNPDFLFVTSSAVLDFKMNSFYEDSSWSAMTCVKDKNIYQIPAKIDSWDMPGPGFVLAMYFMMHCMYPDVCSAELLQEKIDNYYTFLYGKTFTGEEIGYEF